MNHTRVVHIGNDWDECVAEENVTAHMAAIAATPWGYDPRKTKVPTSWVVNYMGRQRRIYADIIGNSSSCYVLVKGERHVVR